MTATRDIPANQFRAIYRPLAFAEKYGTPLRYQPSSKPRAEVYRPRKPKNKRRCTLSYRMKCKECGGVTANRGKVCKRCL